MAAAKNKPNPHPQNGVRLGSPEWVAMMTEKRRAAFARKQAEREVAGGKSKVQPAKESALEKLVPEAIKLLEAQMKGTPCACPNCGEVYERIDPKLAQT